MIPIRLQIEGFLSYRERVDLSFNDFDLACISGSNGAGKSSLLDAITWALFGIGGCVLFVIVLITTLEDVAAAGILFTLINQVVRVALILTIILGVVDIIKSIVHLLHVQHGGSRRQRSCPRGSWRRTTICSAPRTRCPTSSGSEGTPSGCSAGSKPR